VQTVYFARLGELLATDAEALTVKAERLPVDCPARLAWTATMAEVVATEDRAYRLRRVGDRLASEEAARFALVLLADRMPLHARGIGLALRDAQAPEADTTITDAA
jgi:hypothetical protein